MLIRILFNKDKNNKYGHILITLFYFLLHLIVLLKHEHWFDEAQAWVLARNLSLTDLIRILPTEGHPCLWFVFLMPFTKMGISFYYASYISLLIMTLTVYLYMTYAPFSFTVKCGTLLSSMFLFYNPVVVRSYSLIALIVILISIMYKDRTKKPIIYGILVCLLYQGHVVSLGLSIGLTIDLIIEYLKNKNNKKLLLSIAIMILSFIFVILEIMPRADLPSGIDTSAGGLLNKLNIDSITKNLSYFAYTSWGMPKYSLLSFIPYICMITCVILLFVFISNNKTWGKNYQTIIIATCGVGEFFAVLVLVYTPHTQMASILVMIIIFVMWQLYSLNKEKNIRLTCIAMLALISFFTFTVAQSLYRTDLKSDYSSSKNVADIIVDKAEKNSLLIFDEIHYNVPVYAYVISKRDDIEIYSSSDNCDFVYYQLGYEREKTNLEKVLKIYEEKSNNNSYYLTGRKELSDKLKLLYTNEDRESVVGEEYYLYKVIGE